MRRVAFAALVLVTAAGCDKKPPVQIDVADAPKHHEAKRFVVTSGELRRDLQGIHRWRSVNTNGRGGNRAPGPQHEMLVYPIVPEGWTKEDPVPLWVTLSNQTRKQEGGANAWLDDVEAALKSPLRGKVMDYADREPGFRATSGWQKAVDEAQERHGIVSDPHAPILMWPDPVQ